MSLLFDFVAHDVVAELVELARQLLIADLIDDAFVLQFGHRLTQLGHLHVHRRDGRVAHQVQVLLVELSDSGVEQFAEIVVNQVVSPQPVLEDQPLPHFQFDGFAGLPFVQDQSGHVFHRPAQQMA